jgi:sec-independent protein translocase protein TatC
MVKMLKNEPSTDTEQVEQAEEAEESRTRMSFGEHLEELRKCIIHAGYGVVLTVAVCLLYMYQIFDWIVRPYRLALTAHGIPAVFLALKPQEAFFTLINLSFRAGLILASPWIIYQIWKFVGAGLYTKERKIIYRYVGPSVLLFLLGVAFFYFIVLPMTLNFFLNFTSHTGGLVPTPSFIEQSLGLGKPPATSAPAPEGTNPATLPAPLRIPELAQDPPAPPPGEVLLFYNSTDSRVVIMRHKEKRSVQTVAEDSLFANTWRADDYLNFVFFTALVFGLAFEMPMVILVLAQTDIVRAKTFRSVRKYAYFGILVGAVIAAPSGDLMTLAFLFVPLVTLYEVGIITAAISTRGREEAE